jgi:hypothetical protein
LDLFEMRMVFEYGRRHGDKYLQGPSRYPLRAAATAIQFLGFQLGQQLSCREATIVWRRWFEG